LLCPIAYFPLRTFFAVSHRFWLVVLSFSLSSRNLLISSLIYLCNPMIIEQHVIQYPII
jgi:hypothetical protein